MGESCGDGGGFGILTTVGEDVTVGETDESFKFFGMEKLSFVVVGRCLTVTTQFEMGREVDFCIGEDGGDGGDVMVMVCFTAAIGGDATVGGTATFGDATVRGTTTFGGGTALGGDAMVGTIVSLGSFCFLFCPTFSDSIFSFFSFSFAIFQH